MLPSFRNYIAHLNLQSLLLHFAGSTYSYERVEGISRNDRTLIVMNFDLSKSKLGGCPGPGIQSKFFGAREIVALMDDNPDTALRRHHA